MADRSALVGVAAGLGTRLLVTLGERGAALVGESGDVRVIPAPHVEAVDTTGAGDAFVGAFAFGLASGWDEVDAVRLDAPSRPSRSCARERNPRSPTRRAARSSSRRCARPGEDRTIGGSISTAKHPLGERP